MTVRIRHALGLGFSVTLIVACGPDTSADGTTQEESGETASPEPFPEPCTDPIGAGVCESVEPGSCGNAELDTCEICFSSDDGPIECSDETEACDGTELGGATCASLGYASGAPVCSSRCQIDVRDCESCVADSARASCERPRVDTNQIGALALATDGQNLGAAWIASGGALHFARFDQQLQLLGSRDCELNLGYVVSLAASSEGWMVATSTGGNGPVLTLLRLDAAGAELGRATIDGAAYPELATRPGADPFLVYVSTASAATEGPVHARALDAAGASVWDVEVYPATLPNESLRAAFVDPGILVGVRSPSFALELVPVDADGMVGVPVEIDAEGAELELAAESGAAAGFWRTAGGHSHARFDEAGAIVGGIVNVGPLDATVATQTRTISLIDGRAVLGLSEDQRTRVAMSHYGADGDPVVPNYDLAVDPSDISTLESVALGGRVIVAYTTYGLGVETSRFVLAGVAP